MGWNRFKNYLILSNALLRIFVTISLCWTWVGCSAIQVLGSRVNSSGSSHESPTIGSHSSRALAYGRRSWCLPHRSNFDLICLRPSAKEATMAVWYSSKLGSSLSQWFSIVGAIFCNIGSTTMLSSSPGSGMSSSSSSSSFNSSSWRWHNGSNSSAIEVPLGGRMNS